MNANVSQQKPSFPLLLFLQLLFLIIAWLATFFHDQLALKVCTLFLGGIALFSSLRFEWSDLKQANNPLKWMFSHSIEFFLLLIFPFLLYSSFYWVWLLVLRQVFLSLRFVRRWEASYKAVLFLLEKPSLLMITSFFWLVVLGALVLWLPQATTFKGSLSFLDALFTATSASCVTGLAVKSTPTDFTLFGQLSILVLIQIGGFGVMVLSSFILGSIGAKLGLRSQNALGALMDEPNSHRVMFLLRFAVVASLLTEAICAMFLYWRWSDPSLQIKNPLYFAIFHSISAFCNAGFALWDSSLVPMQTDLVSNIVIMILIVLGGLGFPVLASITNKRTYQTLGRFLKKQTIARSISLTFRSLPLNTKLVLIATPILIFSGFLGFLFLEWDHSLKSLHAADKTLAALFQSVTLRTAGFNTVDFSLLSHATIFMMIFFMLIGGASGGTAGGLKVNTFVVTFLSIISLLRGRRDVEFFGRTIDRSLVFKASVIISIFAFLFGLGFFFLLATQANISFHHLMFEMASALATVGLTLTDAKGISTTSKLNEVGRWIIIFTMFVGRVGPLTLAFAISGVSSDQAQFTYPKEHISIG